MLDFLGNLVVLAMFAIMIIVGFFEPAIGTELADQFRCLFLILMGFGVIIVILYDWFN